MHTFLLRRALTIGLACLFLGGVTAGAAHGGQDRPKLTLRASPKVGRSPLRVVLTAELTGGPNDDEEFYCPSVQWEWGDGTESESATDCAPYEPGKSVLKRSFTVEHVFKGGSHVVAIRLKRRDKVLAAATAQVQVQPGVREQLEQP